MSLRPYLGANVNQANVEELHYRGLLEEGETLLALFDGVLLDENGRRIGGLALSDFVVLTDQRLITWARGFFSDTVDGFPWKDVDVADKNVWGPFHGRVRLVFRLPPVAPRSRRISIRGANAADDTGERVFVNTLDYMPDADVAVLAKMVGWIGDQVVAGTPVEELIAGFVENFPAPERPVAMPQLPPPPQMQPEPEAPKRGWLKSRDKSPPATERPEDLINAYERKRLNEGVTPGIVRSSGLQSGSALTPMPEQPSMYDISRGLRLMMEMPRRLGGLLRRSSEVMSGAGELITNVQDPSVRRTAISGLNQAVEQHEQQQGPFAPVAPLVRAVLRFGATLAEPDEPKQPGPDEVPSARRIEVRAAVRQRENASTSGRQATGWRNSGPQPTEIEIEQQPETPPQPVRRQINLRRVETISTGSNGNGHSNGAQQAEPSQPDEARPASTPPRVQVRRIAINRDDDSE